MRAGDDIFSGNAAHTDIIVAATRAYLNALNKLLARQPGRPAPREESARVGV